MRRTGKTAAFLAWLALIVLAVPNADAGAGGGYAGAGIAGQYFANTTLSGAPSFTRSDVRIDFDWGSVGSPGGSSSPGFAAVTGTTFSVRWTGTLIPKYSETYTFKTITAGGVTLTLTPTSGGSATTVINDWTAHPSTTDVSTYTMVAGQSYQVQMVYFTNQPTAVARLHWSSPSTPEEPIEPATPIGLNAGTATDYDTTVMFADAMKMARITPGLYSTMTLDSQGWPTSDGSLVVFAGQNTDVSGSYTLSFTGSANVSIDWCPVNNFTQSYNSATNTTLVTFIVPAANSNSMQLELNSTRRLPSDTTATGVTNLQILRPLTPGDNVHSYPAGTLFTTAFKNLLAQFTVIRFMDYFAMNTNANSVVQWSDRLLPSYSSQQGINGGYQGQGGAIEYAVELCNETGRDLWLNIPIQASDDFVAKLAQGLRYGFDASGLPYTSVSANPVSPPLQPNLRVYLEFSNETWNWGFQQTSIAYQAASDAVNSNTTVGQIINYDGVSNSTIWAHRWLILRMKQISDAFRGTWGDAAMMTTVRPLFLYQYNNANNTAADAFQFLDSYFNNADGVAHVATPHPVNYYLYAGGGGWYNSVLNDSGTSEAVVQNASFETPVLAASTSQAAPTGATWTFSGAAGLVSNNTHRAAAATSTTVGSLITPNSTVGVGYAITIGSAPVYLNELGRYVAAGDNQSHDLYLFDANHNQLAFVTISTSGATTGQYVYGGVGTVALAAGQTYYLVSVESGDPYYDQGSTQTTFSGVAKIQALSIAMPNEWDQTTWTWNNGAAGHVSGPVDFRYATAPNSGPIAYPPDATDGAQAVYLQNGGSISQTLNFPAGVSDIAFSVAQGVSGTGSFTVLLDGSPVLVGWGTPWTPTSTAYSSYRTAVGVNLSAGAHTLTFLGSGDGTVFIDAVSVESADAMLQSGLASIAGTVQSETNWDLAYGLKTAGYEGGFEVGGDNPTPAANAANVDPRVLQDTSLTLTSYLSSGGDLPVVFNATGGAYAVAMDAPLGTDDVFAQNTPKMAAYLAAEATLPPAVTNATLVPRTLTPSNLTLYLSDSDGRTYADSAGNIYLPSGWLSWNIIVPVAGTYSFSATSLGSGGTYTLLLDEVTITSGGSGGTLTGATSLTPGLHCVKVRSTGSAPFQVTNITLAQSGAPIAPLLNSAVFTNAECTLTWSPVNGAVGYELAYGAAPGAYTTFINEGQATSAVLSGLSNSQVYYIAVYAYDAAGHLSLYSNEVRAACRSNSSQLLVNFEGLTVGTTQTLWSFGGMSFTAFGNSGELQIQGSDNSLWPGLWPSNVLWSVNWGNQHCITAANGGPFDLYSLDLLVNDQVGSARIMGYDASGSTFSRVVNFNTYNANGEASASLTLDWTQVVKVVVGWSSAADGANTQRFGAIDNVLFHKTQVAAATPTHLAASAQSTTQASLSWTAASSPGGFVIERATNSDFSAGLTLFALAPGSTANYTDTALNFTGTTVYYYRVRALSGAGDSANSNTAWVAPAGLPPVMLWRLNQFGRADSGGTAADLANLSGDGVANILKYALGGNPNLPDGSGNLPTVQRNGAQQLQFSFHCNSSCSDLTYLVQASTDLVNWTTIASSAGGATATPVTIGTTVSDPGGTGQRTVTVTDGGFTATAGSQRFLRLQVSGP